MKSIAFGFICFCLLSCSGLRRGGAEDFALTESQEYYVGRANCAKIFSSYQVLDPKSDGGLTNYINRIGYSIALKSNRPELYRGYHFGVLRSESHDINAFAFSGGFIFVTTAALSYAKSEDEIAAILAHEISHVNLHHPEKVANEVVKAQEQEEAFDKLLKKTLKLTDILKKWKPGQFDKLDPEAIKKVMKGFDKVVDRCNEQSLKGYEREQELDADVLAIQLLARAGYNPLALKTLLERLRDAKALKDRRKCHHPPPQERIVNVQNWVKSYQKKYPNGDGPFGNLSSAKDESPRQKRFQDKTKVLH